MRIDRLFTYQVFLSLIGITTYGQRPVPKLFQQGVGKYVYQILHDTSSEASTRLLCFPSAKYAPETSLEMGIRAFSLYYVKHDTALNRLSEVSLYSFVTVRGQFGLRLENVMYSHNNKYNLIGRAHYQQFPMFYYGIGPQTDAKSLALVTANSVQMRQGLLRKLTRNWYAGPRIDFQHLQNVTFTEAEQLSTGLPLGATGSTTLEVGASVLYDNRKNVFNVRNGAYLETTLLRNVLNTSDYSFQRLVVDGRLYRPLTPQGIVLALQAMGMFMAGEVPFNSLALLGGESLMRGYYLGRYRDKNLLSAQAEVRWLPLPFSRRWGATVFSGVGTVAPVISHFQFNGIRWAAGGGVRFLFFQKKDVYLRADLGITREGTGLYFSLGEAF